MKLETFQRYYMGIFAILVLQLNMVAIMGVSYMENQEPDYWERQTIFFDFAPGLVQVTFENLMFFFNAISVLSIGLVLLAVAQIFTKKFWSDFGGGRKVKEVKP